MQSEGAFVLTGATIQGGVNRLESPFRPWNTCPIFLARSDFRHIQVFNNAMLGNMCIHIYITKNDNHHNNSELYIYVGTNNTNNTKFILLMIILQSPCIQDVSYSYTPHNIHYISIRNPYMKLSQGSEERKWWKWQSGFWTINHYYYILMVYIYIYTNNLLG